MSQASRLRNRPVQYPEGRPFASEGLAITRLCDKCQRVCVNSQGSTVIKFRGARIWVGRCCNPRFTTPCAK